MARSHRSEIRDSTISELLEKATSRNYGRYLAKVTLKHVRAFKDEPVSFDFPVTAIIGPNGGGKTTVLGAAACAYKGVSPRRFFSKSGKYDESMQDWSIEYELIDRSILPKDVVRRTASFKNYRWKRDALDRPVLVFGVSRTVPPNEKSEFLKCASGTFAVPDSQISELSETVTKAVGKILGKNITGFKRLKVDRDGRITLLTGRTKDGVGYSEFHFGAGESSIIRMVSEIELAGDQALILIEEIENGLHPVAVVRLVEYLIEVAHRKKCQAIFTTHSNDALSTLPSKAIWVATQDKIFQGKLDIQSLRAITGQIEDQLAVFVEDEFARIWFEAILRNLPNIAMDSISVYAMEGDGTAVALNKYHNRDPSQPHPSICFIDGDSRQSESDPDKVYRLPGEAPELFIFDQVIERWDFCGGRLTVALLQPFERVDHVRHVCAEVRITNHDPHLLFSQVGERLGLIPASTVAAAFTNIWAQSNPDQISALITSARKLLPTES